MILKKIIIYTGLLFLPHSIFSYIDYSYNSNLISIRTPLLPTLENNEDFYRLAFSLKNIWSLQYEKFMIDGEEFNLQFTRNFHLTNKVNVGLELTYKLQSGGFLDSFVITFHRITGVTQQHKEEYKKNKIQVSYEPYGQYYQIFDDTPFTKELRRKLRVYPRIGFDYPKFIPLPIIATKNESYFIYNDVIFPLEKITKNNVYDGLDNPRTYFQYKVFENYFHKFYIGIKNKIPIVNKTNYFYSSGLDTGIFMSGSIYFKHFIEFLYGLSYTYYELKRWNDLEMTDHQWSIRLQGNFDYKNFIFFSEYAFISRSILNMGRLSEDSHYITFGIKKIYLEKIYTFSIIENVYFFATSPDIGFYFSIQWTV